jgi:hypothetical protein
MVFLMTFLTNLLRRNKLTYIEKITSEDTGGGVMVDVVHLKDGRCLGITDECVVLCPDFESVFTATADLPSINLLTLKG